MKFEFIKPETLTYEKAMHRLKEINNSLEMGNIELAQAINTYKEGMELVNYCSEQLSAIENELKLIKVVDANDNKTDLT